MPGIITFTEKGSFRNTEQYLARMSKLQLDTILNKYGSLGQNALSNATPTDTGLASQSWSYSVVSRPGYYSIRWHNSDIENGFPVAVMIQYGHGTRGGGYVQGRDYINPAIRPLFDQIAEEAWKEVTKV
jgi:hypothetical protein